MYAFGTTTGLCLVSDKGIFPPDEAGRVPRCSLGIERVERVRAPADASALGASLAHEINNPLDSLLNLLYLIEAEATPAGRHYLALAEEEVHRISQIVHGAMDRFRSPVGPQDTNVPRLLGSVVEFYMSRLDSQGIRVEARYCSGEDLPVIPGALRQVFSNLLLNAAHAMPGGGRMHVRVSRALRVDRTREAWIAGYLCGQWLWDSCGGPAQNN